MASYAPASRLGPHPRPLLYNPYAPPRPARGPPSAGRPLRPSTLPSQASAISAKRPPPLRGGAVDPAPAAPTPRAPPGGPAIAGTPPRPSTRPSRAPALSAPRPPPSRGGAGSPAPAAPVPRVIPRGTKRPRSARDSSPTRGTAHDGVGRRPHRSAAAPFPSALSGAAPRRTSRGGTTDPPVPGAEQSCEHTRLAAARCCSPHMGLPPEHARGQPERATEPAHLITAAWRRPSHHRIQRIWARLSSMWTATWATSSP